MRTKSGGNPDLQSFSSRGTHRWFLAIMMGLWSAGATTVAAESYQWTDVHGTLHLSNEAGEIPEASRPRMTVYRAPHATSISAPLRALQFPRRTYPEQSQGAFAQKVALDLGLIGQAEEDALGPLSGAGIQPAGDWRVTDPLTLTVVDEVVAAARRAAASQRLALSAEGAEAVVRHAAGAFLPAPAHPLALVPPVEEVQNESPVVEEESPVVIEQPPLVIIEQPPVIITEPPQGLSVPVLRGTTSWGRPAHTFWGSAGRPHEMRKRRAEFAQPRRAPAGRPYDTRKIRAELAQPLRAPMGRSVNTPPGPTHLPFRLSHQR